jgi:photosystem II stability/assembly factor-like uncharacterized protein
MKNIYTFAVKGMLFVVLSINVSFGQSSIDEIAHESKNYNEFLQKSKDYFKNESVKKTKDQAQSEAKDYDNDYTKFQRYLHFYNARLTQDGSFFDNRVLYNEAKLRRYSSKNNEYKKAINPNVSWLNMGPTKYLGNQVGLGRTSAVAFHPTLEKTFYVGAGTGGVWKTTDGGLSYTSIGDLLPTLAVSKIVVHQSNPNTIYVATGGKRNSRSLGVFKTTDNGATWQNTFLNFTINSNKQIYEMIADPTNSNKMFTAVLNDGLYLSNDGMGTGTRVLVGDVRDVIFKPNNPNTVYALLRSGQLMRSVNGGTNFSEVATFTNANNDMMLAVTAADPEKIYFTHNNKVEKYTNSGTQFIGTIDLDAANTINGVENISTGSMFISQVNANRMYAGFQSHHRSDNDGVNFNIELSKFLGTVNPDVHVDYNETFVNPLKLGTIYFCNDGGLYEYDEANNAFTDLNTGLLITQFYDIAVSQDQYDRLSGGSQDNANVHRDGRGDWKYITPTGDGMGQEIDPNDSSVLYASYQNGDIVRDINGSKRTVSDGINTLSGNVDGSGKGEWLTPFLLDPNNSSTMYAGYKKVYKSTNRGDTWTAISPEFSGSRMQALTVAPSNSNYIYTLHGGANFGGDILGDYSNPSAAVKKFYATADGGATWNTYDFPGARGSFHIAVDPTNPQTVYLGISGYVAGNKVFKSTNAGQTWTNISGTLPNGPTIAIVALRGGAAGALFVGTDTGVYYKDDTIPDWIEYGALPNVPVSALVVNYCTKTIFAGTHGRSIFSASLPPTTFSTCNYYCTPEISATTVSQKINTVRIVDSNNNEVFNNNATANNEVYQDYSNQTINLLKGKTYTLRLTMNTLDGASHGAAAIDYNNDLDWADASETLGDFQGTNPSANNITKTITFTVPANATDLPSKLRLRLLSGGQTIPNSCLVNGGLNGNTQDYKILFSEAPNYCTPAVSGTPNEKITQVRVLNAGGTEVFRYNSGALSVLYQNSTTENINLEAGKNYTLELSISAFFTASHLAAYVDFNNNLAWEASNELIGNIQSSGGNEFNIIKTIPFTVPADATLTNSSRLRIRFLYNGALIPNPCTQNGGGFAGETEDYNVTISSPLGISEAELSSTLSVSPNPTRDILYLNGVDTSKVVYKIIDLSGRTVVDMSKYNNGISVSGMSNGIYFVIVVLDGVKTVKRVVVE